MIRSSRCNIGCPSAALPFLMFRMRIASLRSAVPVVSRCPSMHVHHIFEFFCLYSPLGISIPPLLVVVDERVEILLINELFPAHRNTGKDAILNHVIHFPLRQTEVTCGFSYREKASQGTKILLRGLVVCADTSGHSFLQGTARI